MGIISRVIKAIKDGLIQEIPPEYQACESCREVYCDAEKAALCKNRALGEAQELSRRKEAVK
jgi:hypothetical protein